MAVYDDLLFVATGISDFEMLRGLRRYDRHCLLQSMLLDFLRRATQKINTYRGVNFCQGLRPSSRQPVARC